jgi:anti-sigma regulatory factor (Ser/Thr protein kinase)
MGGEWKMSLGSDVRLLPCVRSFVEAIAQIEGWPEETTSALVLSVHEAAVNIIRHAHQSDTSLPLHVRCCSSATEVTVELVDEGGPFDIDAVPQLDPSELRPGGRGVYLIRTLMDEVCCRARDEGGNRLTMRKRLPRESSASAR